MASLRAVTGDPLFLPGVPEVSIDPLSMDSGELEVMGVEFRLRAAPVGSESLALLLTASEFGRLLDREGDWLLMGARADTSTTGDLCFTLSTACLAYKTKPKHSKNQIDRPVVDLNQCILQPGATTKILQQQQQINFIHANYRSEKKIIHFNIYN